MFGVCEFFLHLAPSNMRLFSQSNRKRADLYKCPASKREWLRFQLGMISIWIFSWLQICCHDDVVDEMTTWRVLHPIY